jgi:4-amino-4-deoxy-L-arabinose transferase-like glycosyltransferase
MLGGATLTFLSQQTQQKILIGSRSGPATLLALGILVFLLGVLASRSRGGPRWLSTGLAIAAGWLKVEPWQVVLLGLSLPFAALAHYAAGEAPQMLNPAAGWGAWLAAIALAVIGGWQSGSLGLRSRGRILAAAFGLCALAFCLRGFATGSIPIMLTGDEASAGLFAAQVAGGNVDNPFIMGWYSFPSLYFFLPAGGIALLGRTIEALRIPSALAGALTVGAIYLAGSALFNRRVGLLAAILLLGSHYHIHFSRIGLNNIWDGLFYVVALGTLWYGWEREERNALIVAGVAMGLAQYFYPSGRVLVALVFVWLLVSALLNRPRFRRLIPSLLLMSLTMAVVILPLAWFYIEHPAEYLAPMKRVSILGPWLEYAMQVTGLPAWRILLHQFWLAMGGFTFVPLESWYRPFVPLLRPLAATLFLLGLAHLVVRLRESRTILLAFWLAVFVLVGGLSESTPASQRYVAAAPVCFLIAAYGLSESASVAERRWPRASIWISIASFILVAVAAYSDIGFYFRGYTVSTVTEMDQSNTMVAQHLADFLQDKPASTEVVFFGQPRMGYNSIPSASYLAPQITAIDATSWGAPDHPVPTGEDLVFVFLPGNASQIRLVRAAYPGGVLQSERSGLGETLYYLYLFSGR